MRKIRKKNVETSLYYLSIFVKQNNFVAWLAFYKYIALMRRKKNGKFIETLISFLSQYYLKSIKNTQYHVKSLHPLVPLITSVYILDDIIIPKLCT